MKCRAKTLRPGSPEPLEARIAPATFTWNNPASGAWATAANWTVTGIDADGIPDADDDVTINPATVGLIVTISAGAQAANSLSMPGDDRLQITSGSLTISANSSIDQLALSGGTLTANGVLTLKGVSTVSGNSNLTGFIRNEGIITFSGDPNLGSVIDNAGTMVNTGQIDFSEGGRVNNLAGALFENTGTGSFANFAGSIGIFNDGTFRQAGTGTPVLSMAFHNTAHGVIEVNSGSLNISGSGTWEGGDLRVATGSQLLLSTGTKTLAGVLTGSGGGKVRVTSGTLQAGSSGAEFNFPASYLEIAGNTNLTGGIFSNTGSLSFPAGSDPNLLTVLNNEGTVTVTGQIDFSAGGRVNNLAGALFELAGAGNFANFAGSVGFFNSGTFRHSGTSAAGTSTVPFNNSATGVVDVTGGTLVIAGSGTWDGGTLNVADESELQLSTGTKTITSVLTGSGDGKVRATSGTLQAGAGGAVLNFPIAFFEIAGNTTIAGGTISNAGSITIPSGSEPNLATLLDNAGTVIVGGQIDLSSGGRVNNLEGALFELAGLGNISNFAGSIGFYNSGKVLKSGAGTGGFSTAVFNNSVPGEIVVAGGSLSIPGNGTWAGGKLTVAAGSQLLLSTGTKIFTGELTGSGDGKVRATSGTLQAGAGGATLNFPIKFFEINGNTTMSGGTFSNAGSITIPSGSDPNLATVLDNAGTIVVGGQIDLSSGGRVNNQEGAVFEFAGLGNISNFSGSIGFYNSGKVLKSGAGTAGFSTAVFNNNMPGEIAVVGGSLAIPGNGTWAGGTLAVAAGSQLLLSGGTKTFTGELKGSGAGQVRATSGTLQAGPGGAVLNFPAAFFEIVGNTTISGGTFTNAGTLSIPAGSDPNLQTLIINEGTLNVAGQVDFLGGARVNNLEGALVQMTGAGNFSVFAGSIGFFNSGTFRYAGTNLAGPGSVTFDNTGTVEVASGTLRVSNTPQISGPSAAASLSGGTWIVRNGATLDFSPTGITTNAAMVVLDGTGSFPDLHALTANQGSLSLLGGRDFTATNAFTNNGALVISPGSILATPAFTQGIGGSIEWQLAGLAAGQQGRITVSGAATLAGSASVTLQDGFGGIDGQGVSLMTYASRSGDFSAVDGLVVGGVQFFDLQSQANALKLIGVRDAADLRPEGITEPATGFLGKDITVTFTVRNLKDAPTFAPSWSDSLYLSADAFLDDSDVLVGTARHTGEVGPNGAYTGSITAPLPAAVAGKYHLIVVTDSGRENADADRFNNAAASAGLLQVDLPRLAHGVTEATVISAGENLYYQIDGLAGRDLLLTGSVGKAGAARFYAKLDGIPTAADFDVSAVSLTELQQKLALFSTTTAPYVLLVEGTASAGEGTGLSLSTRNLGFEIVSVTPDAVAATDAQTITIVGSHFSANTTVRLVDSQGAELAPANVTFQNANTLVAQFPLTSARTGLYDLRLTDRGAVAIAEDEVLVGPAVVTHSGTLTGSERWVGGVVHYITADVAVPAGATLTIDPGAIVKLAPLANLEVFGNIVAGGTLAEPIYFTSVRDDVHGGDTNEDGEATAPGAGDWARIRIVGSGVFDHAELLFGGGSAGGWSATAALYGDSGTVTFKNGAIRDAFFDGLLAWGANVSVENSTFVRNDRAISAHPGSPVTVKNSTFDDNRIALLIHGGTLSVANSIVFGSLRAGIDYDFGTFLGATNTLIFSQKAGAVNYIDTANLTGTNGNISADPKFKNASIGDYRLNFGSPAIDAGNGALAPTTDARGLARYDDPRSPNASAGAPAFPDMGAFEFVENAPSPLDLVVTSVVGEPVVTGGGTMIVTWTVQNRGTEVARGDWHDAIQLVSHDGTVALNAGTALSAATLAPGQSATFSTTVSVPYGTEGQYRLQVKTNVAGEIFEGQNTENNTGLAAETTALRVPRLEVGGTFTGSFSKVGEGFLFRVRPDSGDDLRFFITRADGGLTELFLQAGAAPTQNSFLSHRAAAGAEAALALSDALPQDYYLFVSAETLPAGATAFTLSSIRMGFDLQSVDVTESGNQGTVTVPLRGSGFAAGLTATLIGPHGQTRAATAVRVEDPLLAFATFNLSDLELGSYDIQVTQGAATDLLADVFGIVANSSPGTLQISVQMPQKVRAGREFTAWIEYTNSGDTDLISPLITVKSPTGNLLRLDADEAYGTSFQMVAVSPDGAAGVLRPGQTVRVPILVQAISGTNRITTQWVGAASTTAYDWAGLRARLDDATGNRAGFAAVFDALRAGATTTGDYVELISQAATLLGERDSIHTQDLMWNLTSLVRDRLADAGATLVAHVQLFDANRPLDGVTVAAIRVSDGALGGFATSTADGLLRWEGLAPGVYRLEVDGYLQSNVPVVTVPAAGKLDAGALTLRPGGTIAGRIGAGPGENFENEAVMAVGANGRLYTGFVKDDGTFAISGLPNGRYEVIFASGNLVLPRFNGIAAVEGSVTALTGVVATAHGTITGVVHDTAGQPLEGVAVTVASADGNTRTAFTDAAGIYSIDRVSPGPRTLTADAEGLLPQILPDVIVAPGASTTAVNFALAPAGTVSGTVTIGGTPAPKTVVTLRDSGGNAVAFTVTDANGNYRITDLAPADYTIEADYWKAGPESAPVTLAPGGGTATANMQLDHLALLQGRLTDTANHALAGVTLLLIKPSGEVQIGMSDAAGNYSFSRLDEAGSYTVLLADGSNRRAFTLADAAAEATVNYSLAVGSIIGKLVEADGTTPAQGRVALIRNGQEIASTTTDAAGGYVLPTVTGGAFTLLATAGDETFPARTVTAVAGQTVDAGKIAAGSSKLTLRFVNEAGEPVIGVAHLSSANALDARFSEFSGVLGDAENTWGGLAPGQYRIFYISDGYALYDTVVTVASGANEITATLSPAAELAGVVRDGNNVTLAGVTVVVYEPGLPDFARYLTTDANGHYSLRNLEGGNYTVLVLDDRDSSTLANASAANVVVTAGTPVTRDLQLTTPTTEVHGTVNGGTLGNPIGAKVTAYNVDGIPVATAVTNIDGTFTFTTLDPGTYTLRAAAKGHYVDSSTVAVAAGQTVSAPDLAALWLADPPNPPEAEQGWGEWIGSLPASITDFFADLVGDEPVPNDPFFPAPQIPDPECGGDAVLAAFKARLQAQEFAREVFQNWQDRWQATNQIIAADASIFAINAVKFASNFLSAAPAATGAFEKFLAPFIQRTKNAEQQVLDAGWIPVEEMAEYDRLIDLAQTAENQVRNFFLGRLNLPTNVMGTTLAIAGGGLGSGQALIDKLASISSWDGPDDLAEFAGLAADAAANLTGIFSTISLLIEISDKVAPEFSGILGQISDGLATIKSAIDGLRNGYREYEALNENERLYNEAVNRVNKAQQALVSAQAAAAQIECPPDDPPPPPGPQNPGGGDDAPGVGSFDPNDKLTIGFGDGGFIRPGTTLPYTVRFENVSTASAAAQAVTVTDQLSANLDWSTVELGTIGFNGVTILVPSGLQHFETTVTVGTDPNPVRVVGDFCPATGVLSWTIASFDRVTGQLPEDPDAGFLPPNNAQEHGEGFVSYSVKPLSTLADGAVIENQARIVFDLNAPIDTPLVTNTIDSVAPSTSVTAQPPNQPNNDFLVSWSGSDGTGGAGIATYDVYMSDNGGAYVPFVLGTNQTSATFSGEFGHTYRFYSIGTDEVGNVEDAPSFADTLTLSGSFEPVAGRTFTDFDGDKFTIKVSGGGTAQIILAEDGHVALLKLTETTAKSKVSIVVKASGGGNGNVELESVIGDGSLGGFLAPKAVLTHNGFVLGGSLGKLILGDVNEGADISFGGDAAKKATIVLGIVSDGSRITTGSQISTLTVADFGEGRVTATALGKLTAKTGGFDADIQVAGSVGNVSVKTSVNPGEWSAASFGSIVIGTGLHADLVTPGSIAGVQVKAGSLTGNLTAAAFGAISVAGGDLSGDIVSTSSTLGKKAALAKLSVTGGDLLGDIALQGALGAVTVKANKAGAGGNVTSVNVTASKIAALTIAKTLTDSAILAGTSAGTNHELGGGDDSFAPGSIGPVKIGGNAIASVIAAGLSNPDGIFNNGDDSLLGAAPKITSKIAALIVNGSDITGSYFAAAAIGAKPKVGGAVVALPNPQFRTA